MPTLWPVQFATVPLSRVIKPISVPPEMHPRGPHATAREEATTLRFKFLVFPPYRTRGSRSDSQQYERKNDILVYS